MAIHDVGMFTVKEINRLKILQDVIERNLRPGQAAEMLGNESGGSMFLAGKLWVAVNVPSPVDHFLFDAADALLDGIQEQRLEGLRRSTCG